jgi:hypothetical protein
MSIEYFERAQAYRDSLLRLLDDYIARLQELDNVPVHERVRMTYTVGNLTYSWDEYRRTLHDSIQNVMDSLTKIPLIFPVEVRLIVR